MNIKVELLKEHISGYINSYLNDFEIDADTIADSVAISMLAEIQSILKNEDNTDFEIVEKIVCVFNKHRIDCGTCHDF